jgi:hypothetical protein
VGTGATGSETIDIAPRACAMVSAG